VSSRLHTHASVGVDENIADFYQNFPFKPQNNTFSSKLVLKSLKSFKKMIKYLKFDFLSSQLCIQVKWQFSLICNLTPGHPHTQIFYHF